MNLVEDISSVFYRSAEFYFPTVRQLSILKVLSSLALDCFDAFLRAFGLGYIYIGIWFFSLFGPGFYGVELNDVDVFRDKFTLRQSGALMREDSVLLVIFLLFFNNLFNYFFFLDKIKLVNWVVLIFYLRDVIDIFLRLLFLTLCRR